MAYKFFRSATIDPQEVLAGDSVEFIIKLQLNENFTANSSRIILDMPGYIGYSRPTRYHQELNGFMEIFCSNPDIYYTQRVWDMETGNFASIDKISFKGMAQRIFVIDFKKGETTEGDEIVIKWGYMCNGFSSGTRVTSIVPLKEFYNTVNLRYFKDGTLGLPDYGRSFKGYSRPAPDEEIPLRFRILPREPENIRLIHRDGKSNLLIFDRFYNICDVKDLDEYIQEDIKIGKNSEGVFESDKLMFNINSKKLPLYTTPIMTDIFQGKNIYFGDLHTHSSFSKDCIERERLEITPDLSFQFGKNVACLDFMAVTDHHAPQKTERSKIGKENWGSLLAAVNKHSNPGQFIAFSGFEFQCERGDTVIIFNENISYDKINSPEIKNIKDLWKQFKGLDYITIPHLNNPGKLDWGKWYYCPDEGIEPVIEIFSCHGSYERDDILERHIAEIKKFRSDRQGKYFLTNGYRYGYCCNSDGHKGNPGFNGLTAVYAYELTGDAIIQAIRRRNIYGTTNSRIRLLFTLNGNLMGSVLPNVIEKEIYISIAGERPFKAIDLFRDGELYKRFRPNTINFEMSLKVIDEQSSNWYVRGTQVDNHIAYSSPIWLE